MEFIARLSSRDISRRLNMEYKFSTELYLRTFNLKKTMKMSNFFLGSNIYQPGIC